MAESDRTRAFTWSDQTDVEVVSAAAYEREQRSAKAAGWLFLLAEDARELRARARRLDVRVQ